MFGEKTQALSINRKINDFLIIAKKYGIKKPLVVIE